MNHKNREDFFAPRLAKAFQTFFNIDFAKKINQYLECQQGRHNSKTYGLCITENIFESIRTWYFANWRHGKRKIIFKNSINSDDDDDDDDDEHERKEVQIFKCGVPHKTHKKWNAKHRLIFCHNYHKSSLHGKQTDWFDCIYSEDESTWKRERFFNKGKMISVREYFTNGKLHLSLQFRDGRLHGEQRAFDRNGELQTKTTWWKGHVKRCSHKRKRCCTPCFILFRWYNFRY